MLLLSSAFVFALILMECQGQIRQGPVPPNIDAFRKGVNVLFGQTPNEQNFDLEHPNLFNFDGYHTSKSNGYSIYKQISRFSAAPGCQWDSSSHVDQLEGIHNLEHQIKRHTSHGEDMLMSLNLPVPGKKEKAAALLLATLFGNSNEAIGDWNMYEEGFKYSFGRSASSSLYTARIDYDKLGANDWTDRVKDAAKKLGSSPSNLAVVKFCAEFGTHGIETATMGKFCTSSTFLKSTDANANHCNFADFFRNATDEEASFLNWAPIRQKSAEEYTKLFRGNDVIYQRGNRYCKGEVATGKQCFGKEDRDFVDEPAFIRWTYKPIWEMNIPNLSSAAKSTMKNLIKIIFDYGMQCSYKACNGHGACPTNLKYIEEFVDGKNPGPHTTLSVKKIWNHDRCFCHTGYHGQNCEKVSEVCNGPPKFTQPLDKDMGLSFSLRPKYYKAPLPISGFASNFSRCGGFGGRYLHRFAQSEVQEMKHTKAASASQRLPSTPAGLYWSRYCDQDKVMIGIDGRQYKYNHYYESSIALTCARLMNTGLDQCKSMHINAYKEPIEFTCLNNQVLNGWRSYPNSDRVWIPTCCSLVLDEHEYVDMPYRGYARFTPLLNSTTTKTGYVLTSWTLAYSNSRKDFYQYMTFNRPSSPFQVAGSYTFNPSKAKRPFYLSCPTGSWIAGMWSDYIANSVDRTWKITCIRYKDYTADKCQWIDNVAAYNSHNSFIAGEGFALTGFKSSYSATKGRVFSYRTCRIVPV